MSVPKGCLPTGRPDMLWNKHPKIMFFYGTASKRYIYFLYRASVQDWTWEIWLKPKSKDEPRILERSSIQVSGDRMQFKSAYAQANVWLNMFEDDKYV